MNSNVVRQGAASGTTKLLLFTLFALAAFARLSAQTSVVATGIGKPFSNLQDSMALNFVFPQEGAINDDSGFGLGMVRIHAGYIPQLVPGGSLADGHTVPTSAPAGNYLNTLFGTTYGGSGTSFNVPNLAGRAVVGAGMGPGLSNWTLGQKQGAATVTLKEENLPPHVHSLPGGKFTAVSGKGVPYDNVQPSTALNYIIRTNGLFPPREGAGAAAYMGTVLPWAGSLNNIPAGWTPADGRLIDIGGPQGNSALYAILGTRFGGNGTSNFALPDLRGRTIVGAGERPGAFGSPVGERFGSEKTTLFTSQMPTHTHPTTPSGTTGPAGDSHPVDNRQPSLALTYAIATDGIYPTSSQIGPEIRLGEVVAFAGDFVPGGFLLADGRTLPINDYPALAGVLSVTYGGDGVTNFKLPDLRARTIIGAGPGAPIGMVAGAAAQLPPGTAAGTISEEEEIVYMVGELAGTSDIVLDVENLGEHGFEVIPEPATLTLFGLSILSTIHRRNRRRPVTPRTQS